jgi:hypothetical protein
MLASHERGGDRRAPGGEAPIGNPQARIVVRDDLSRSRLTVFFRFFLALPHLILLGIWSLIALLMAIINWFAILFTGRTCGAAAGGFPPRPRWWRWGCCSRSFSPI